MQKYVISLKSATARRESIQTQFTAQNVGFEFFDAVAPSPELTQHIRRLCPALETFPMLTNSEKSCFINHLLLWEKCVVDGLPYLAIFEDDVIISQNFGQLMNNETAWLTERFPPKQAWYLRLEASMIAAWHRPSDVASLSLEEREFTFPNIQSIQWGTAGYLISQMACRNLLKLIFNISPEKLISIDNLLYDRHIPTGDIFYQINPAICVQADFLNKEKYPDLASGLQKTRSEIRSETYFIQTKKKNPFRFLIKLWTRKQRKLEQKIRQSNTYLVAFEDSLN